MLQFSYRLRVAERVKAKCDRHPRYNPERDGRGGIKGGCATCFSLYDLYQARLALDSHTVSFSGKRFRGRELPRRAARPRKTQKLAHLAQPQTSNP